MLFVISRATARGHQIHRSEWQPRQVNLKGANMGDSGAGCLSGFFVRTRGTLSHHGQEDRCFVSTLGHSRDCADRS